MNKLDDYPEISFINNMTVEEIQAYYIKAMRRYLVIKGGACLVALARERGRQHRSRTG